MSASRSAGVLVHACGDVPPSRSRSRCRGAPAARAGEARRAAAEAAPIGPAAATAAALGGHRRRRPRSSVVSRPVPSYGAATWPTVPDSVVGERQLAVLEHQRPEVARVEELDPDVRVELAQPAQLAVLLPHEPLLEGRQLDVEVEVGQVEVRREALDDRRRRGSTGSGRCAARTPSGPRRSRGSGPARPRWRGRTGPVEVTDPGQPGDERRRPSRRSRSRSDLLSASRAR